MVQRASEVPAGLCSQHLHSAWCVWMWPSWCLPSRTVGWGSTHRECGSLEPPTHKAAAVDVGSLPGSGQKKEAGVTDRAAQKQDEGLGRLQAQGLATWEGLSWSRLSPNPSSPDAPRLSVGKDGADATQDARAAR